MIANREEGFRKYLARYPDRSIEYDRDSFGVERLHVVYPNGEKISVNPDELLPE